MGVEYAVTDGVAVLTVNHPPVNALSLVVREGLMNGLQRALTDDAVKAIVVKGGGNTFIAGADITEFGTEKSRQGPRLQELQHVLETSPKPTVAAIHGTALGGGFEIALACHARIAVASAKVGLPEVKLGLLPGAGGTVRTPRLTGAEVALSIVTSGEHVPAAKALNYGLIDAVIEDLERDSVTYARKLAADGAPAPVIERTDKIANTDPSVFQKFRESSAKKFRGQLAPAKIIDCIEAACTKTVAEASAFETAGFQELFKSDQRAALIHYFFAEREARKIPDIPETVKPKTVKSAAVIGAGLMGGGIAMVFANAGIPVTVLDVSDEAIAKGRGTIEKNSATSVSRGSMPQARMDQALGRMRFVTKYDDIGPVDIVVEAAFEDMDLKKKIFAELDRVLPADAILASNTSSLDIDQIASATKRPGSVVGVHFFSPANVMKLQENVRGKATSHQTLSTVMSLAKPLGKVAVLAGNCDGFIGNRMLQYYTGEAEFMLEEGATPEQIDRVAENFGMAMGPLAMRDLAGMDTSVRIRAIRRKTLPADERMTDIVERLVEAGRFGQKSNKGYYRYEGRNRIPDPEAIAIIEESARANGVTRRPFSDEEVLHRLFFPMVNEAAKELEEGVAIRASDIDVVWVNGYGFPAHHGGPMFWAEQTGLEKVLATSRELAPRRGIRWAPAKLLERLVAEGKGWSGATAKA
ncbi:MAG: 3-hydroxyacyl-CoA dehydrogenase NAD-binding domain-containing protein [Terricaulis sp.]